MRTCQEPTEAKVSRGEAPVQQASTFIMYVREEAHGSQLICDLVMTLLGTGADVSQE